MTADENLPPGVTEDGVADAQALAAAHAGLLRDQPYVANVSVVNRFSNGTLALERNRTVRYDDGEHVHDYRPRGPMTISQFDRRTIWGNDTVTLVRSEGPNGSVTYDRTSQSTGFGVPNYWQETVYGLVGAGGFTIETTFLSDPSKFRIASSDLVIAEAVDNATVSVLVDERGFVQEYRYEYDRKLRDDVPVHTVRTVEFSTVDGSTVSTPSWYDEAVNATADDPGGP